MLIAMQDCKPKAVIRPSPQTKIHQMRFLPNNPTKHLEDVLAISTEDGRIVFYAVNDPSHQSTADVKTEQTAQKVCHPIAQLGGIGASIVGRTKDFELHALPSADDDRTFLIVTASSDGAVRLWTLSTDSLLEAKATATQASSTEEESLTGTAKQVGELRGTRETGNRITCLTSFIMDEPVEEGDGEEGEEEFGGFSDGAPEEEDGADV